MNSRVDEWSYDPFDPSNGTLWSLQSGKVASPDLARDFKSAKDDSEKPASDFSKERIILNEKPLMEPMKKNRRLSFLKPPIFTFRISGQ